MLWVPRAVPTEAASAPPPPAGAWQMALLLWWEALRKQQGRISELPCLIK